MWAPGNEEGKFCSKALSPSQVALHLYTKLPRSREIGTIKWWEGIKEQKVLGFLSPGLKVKVSIMQTWAASPTHCSIAWLSFIPCLCFISFYLILCLCSLLYFSQILYMSSPYPQFLNQKQPDGSIHKCYGFSESFKYKVSTNTLLLWNVSREIVLLGAKTQSKIQTQMRLCPSGIKPVTNKWFIKKLLWSVNMCIRKLFGKLHEKKIIICEFFSSYLLPQNRLRRNTEIRDMWKE